MEYSQATTDLTAEQQGQMAETEHAFKRLQRDVGNFVQRRPVQIALASCAGLGVIAGGGALIGALRETKQQRARAWFGRQAGMARKKARGLEARARSNAPDLMPSAGLLAAGALIGAGMTLLLSPRRATGSQLPGEVAEHDERVTKQSAPDYH